MPQDQLYAARLDRGQAREAAVAPATPAQPVQPQADHQTASRATFPPPPTFERRESSGSPFRKWKRAKSHRFTASEARGMGASKDARPRCIRAVALRRRARTLG